MKKFLVILFMLLSLLGYSFNSFNYLNTITSTSEGFSHVFTVFNNYPYGVFSSPQSVSTVGSYSLFFGVNGFIDEFTFYFSGHFKLFDRYFFSGFAFYNSYSEVYNYNFEYLGDYQQNFLIFGLGTKFSKIFYFSFGDIDFGASLLLSTDIFNFPAGLYELNNYFFEFFTIPTFGIVLNTVYNFDLSVTHRFFIGHYLSRFSFGTDTKFGVRYHVLSLISSDKNIYKYFIIYPFLSYGFIGSFSDIDYVNDFKFGIGFTSELFEGLKISFGIDNKGFSLSLLLTFFSSPIGFGNLSYDATKYSGIIPSLFLGFNEKTVKEVLGVTPDREEVEKGIIEYEKGNFSVASFHFEKALRINPSNEIAQIYIQKLKLWLESDELLSNEQREYIKTLLSRANLLKSQSKYGDAIKDYKKVLEINPYNKEAIDSIKEIENIVSVEISKNYKEALDLYSKNNLLEAKRVISRNFDLNPFHELSIKLAKEIDDKIQYETSKKLDLEQKKILSYSLYSQGLQEFSSYNFAKALELFNKALEVYPENSEAEEALKKTLKEIEMSSKIQENKSRSDGLVLEGKKLKSDGKYWEAVDKFREALRFFRDNEIAKSEIDKTIEIIKSNASVLEKEGDESFVNGDVAKAFDKWREALSMLRSLPESVSLKQKIEAKTEELKASIDIRIANAISLLDNKDYLNVIKIIQEVLKLDPTNKRALDILSNARKKFDEYLNKRFDEGVSMFNKKDYVNSLIVFEELISVLDKNDSRYARIKRYYDEAKINKDKLDVERKISEKFKEAYALLVNYDYEGAKKILVEVLQLDPNNTEAKSKLSEIEKRLKEAYVRDEANKLLSAGLREIRKKNYIEGISMLKDAKKSLSELGDDVSFVDEYIRSAEEEFKLERDSSFKQGKSAYEKGDYLKAKELLEIALKNNPGSSEIKVLLMEVNNRIKVIEKEFLDEGDRLYNSGNYDGAYDKYNYLVRISPDNELYKLKLNNVQRIKEGMNKVSNLIRASDKIDSYIEAMEIVDQLISLNSADENLKLLKDGVLEKLVSFISFLKIRADEFIKNNEYRKAINLLEVVLKSDPNDADAKSKISLVKSKLQERIDKNLSAGTKAYDSGNYKEAIRLLSLVLEDDPTNVVARRLKDQATAKYNEIVSKDRDKLQREITSYMSKGVEEYRKGNVDSAIKYWQMVLELDPDNEQAKRYIARAKLGK
ncbi:MAG: tetratricopeptide repeat protein [Brevinematia bacterium]